MSTENETKQQTASDPAVGSRDLLGAYYRGSDGAATCALCNCEMEWVECQAGCDDGYFDGYEEDPLWHDQGDLVPCHECGGQGGFYWCETKECPTKEGLKLIPAPGAPNARAEARRDNPNV
jgi:hypothetical protein